MPNFPKFILAGWRFRGTKYSMNNYYGLTTDHARFLKAGIDANHHIQRGTSLSKVYGYIKRFSEV